MRRVMSIIVCLGFAAAVVGILGCPAGGDPAGSDGNSGTQDRAADLRQLGSAYLDYHDVNRQGPPDWETLLEFTAQKEDRAAAIRRIREAGYTVKWGVKLQDATEGTMNFVLAESPQGGPKLMLDGTVSQ